MSFERSLLKSPLTNVQSPGYEPSAALNNCPLDWQRAIVSQMVSEWPRIAPQFREAYRGGVQNLIRTSSLPQEEKNFQNKHLELF